MQHLASDLLSKSLSPKQISKAVVRELRIAKSSNIEVHKHLMPVFSGIERVVVQDCKLSHLAYGFVLMNADDNRASVERNGGNSSRCSE